MKKIIFSLLILSAGIWLASCARGITPSEAANGRAKCNRYIR